MRGRPLFVGPMIHLRTVPAFEALGQAPLTALAREAEEVPEEEEAEEPEVDAQGKEPESESKGES